MTESIINRTMLLWNEMESCRPDGFVKKLYSPEMPGRIYCTYRYPERYCGIALSFSKNIMVDTGPFRKLSDFRVRFFDDNSFDNASFLSVELLDDTNRGVFSTLCEDLVRHAVQGTDETETVHGVINLLEKWKNLFGRMHDSHLSLTEQQGLFGELCFLQELFMDPRISNKDSILAWVGADRAARDFRGPAWAVEVKTTATSTHDKLSINGESQLDDSKVERMWLAHYALEVSNTAGCSLADKVNETRAYVEDDLPLLTELNMKLMEAGYFNSEQEDYSSKKYVTESESFYRVKGDFPRIRQGELRSGVSVSSYLVDVPVCEKYLVTKEELLNGILS